MLAKAETATDWQGSAKLQNSTSYFYFATDQWRSEEVDTTPLVAQNEKPRYRHPDDYNVLAARLGWLPSYPTFNKSGQKIFDEAKAAGFEDWDNIKKFVSKSLKEKSLQFAIEDPENFPRNMFIWRNNLIGSSSKGYDYFLKFHPFQPAVDPLWEAKTDWDIFRTPAKAVPKVVTEAKFPIYKDVFAAPIQHDSEGETAQPEGKILDWSKGDCEPIPGKTMPAIGLIEHDYTKIYDRWIALEPNIEKGMAMRGIFYVSCANGWMNRESAKYMYFNNVETKPGIGYSRLENGLPAVCTSTCVGRIRYLGIILYDADEVFSKAARE